MLDPQFPSTTQEIDKENADWFSQLYRDEEADGKIFSRLNEISDGAYGFQIADARRIFQQSEMYRDKAKLVQQSDPLACSILIHHSSLKFDEFRWLTWDLSDALLTGAKLR